MLNDIIDSNLNGFLFGGAAMNFHIPGFRKIRNTDVLVESPSAFSKLPSRSFSGIAPDVVLDRKDFKIAKMFVPNRTEDGRDETVQIRFFWFDDFPPDGFGSCEENPRVLSLDALLVTKLFAQTETLPCYFDFYKNLVDLAALFHFAGKEVFEKNVEKLRAFYEYTLQFPNNIDRAVSTILSRGKALGRSLESLGVDKERRRDILVSMLEMSAVVRRICGKKEAEYESLPDYEERCF